MARRVAVRYDGEEKIFLGQELREEGSKVVVRYDDGEEGAADRAWVTYVVPVRPRLAREQLRVFAKFVEDDHEYFAGALFNVLDDGMEADVRFDDGDEKTGVLLSSTYTAAGGDKEDAEGGKAAIPSPGQVSAPSTMDEYEDDAFIQEAASPKEEEDEEDDDDDLMIQTNVAPEHFGAMGADDEEVDIMLRSPDDILPAEDEEDEDPVVHVAFLQEALGGGGGGNINKEPQEWRRGSPGKKKKKKKKNAASPRRTKEEAGKRPGTTEEDRWGFANGADDAEPKDTKLNAAVVPAFEAARLFRLGELRADRARRADARPDDRLGAVLVDCCLLEQARSHGLLVGKSEVAPNFMDWSARVDDEDEGEEDTEGRTKSTGDALLELRMRAVALCRLCYGTTATETLHALADLAAAYANEALWAQALTHATRCDQLAALKGAAPAVDHLDSITRLADGVVEVFDRLRLVASTREGKIPWNELVSLFNGSDVEELREQPWGVRDDDDSNNNNNNNAGDATNKLGARSSSVTKGSGDLSWAEAVSFMRKHHAGFAKVVGRLEAAAFPHDVAVVHFAFEAADENGASGVASAPSLRAAVVRSPLAAGALETSTLATWLARRCADWRSRANHHVHGNNNNDDNDNKKNKTAGTMTMIPVAWEEVIAVLALDAHDHARQRSAVLARAQVLLGRSNASLAKYAVARVAFERALDLGAASSAVLAEAHAGLADVHVAAHVERQRALSKRYRADADRWLETEEGHRLWRTEVRRLMQDLRDRGGLLTTLTKPEVECRARDVLLHAREQYLARKHDEGEKAALRMKREEEEAGGGGGGASEEEVDDAESPLHHLDVARRHLEEAMEAELRWHGSHRQNVRVPLALAALGNLDVVSGDFAGAQAKIAHAADMLRAATNGKPTLASVTVAVQLAKVAAKNPNRTEADADAAAAHLANAAAFHNCLAQEAADLVANNNNNNNNSTNQHHRGGGNTGHQAANENFDSQNTRRKDSVPPPSPHEMELAAEAKVAHARKARLLWTDLAAARPRHPDQQVEALTKALAAATLADGDTSAEAMKALRHLAKVKQAHHHYADAAADYAALEHLALKAGASDIARKAHKQKITARKQLKAAAAAAS